MGADFLFCYFCIDGDQDLELTRKSMLKAVDVFDSIDDSKEWYLERCGLDNLPNIEDIKEDYRIFINELFDTLDARDVSWIDHRGDRIWLTGGMSWGDEPTDSYYLFERFIYLPEQILKAGRIHFS